MPRLTWSNLHFATLTFVAAIVALFLAMSIDLRQPYWAMMTVYIVSNPMAAAVRSKAIYRLAGTLLGASAAVVMVPRLVDSPALLCLAMALWVGGCLAVSLLDRSPRSYLTMLSGYTAAIIGFASIYTPEAVFDLAVLRVQEIAIGIVCATLAHSLWFPRPVGHAIRSRFDSWLDEADRWALDILSSGDPARTGRDRVRLAEAASEIHQLATHLPFDTSHLRQTTALVRALHDRVLLLLPLLSSLSDRLAALRAEWPHLDADSRAAVDTVATWLQSGAPHGEARAICAKLAGMGGEKGGADWYALNRLAFLTRLRETVNALTEARALLASLYDPQAALPADLAETVGRAGARPLHSDPGLAALSGFSAMLAVLITCAVWIGLGWHAGYISAMLAAVVSCLFAALDDPTPGIRVFGVTALAAFPLSAIYLFGVFPSIDSFPLLALTLAPPLIAIGAATTDPRHALPALMTLLSLCNMMAIQERVSTDFATFVNNSLSQFFGLFVATYVTRGIRAMSADASARRLLARSWRGIARLAAGADAAEPVAFASRMVDRLGLLAPRLAVSRADDLAGVDALAELRTGMDVATLRHRCGSLPDGARGPIDELLGGLAEHYARRGGQPPGESLLQRIDRALHALAALPGAAGPTLAAVVGLRRNLFPQAPFAPCPTGKTAP